MTPIRAVPARTHDRLPSVKRNYNSRPIPVKRDGSNVERPVRSRTELEEVLRPGKDGLILADRRGRSATFLPQVWDELPDPHDFVAHLLAKAGIRPSYDWTDSEIDCQRYEVTAYAEH